MIPGQFKVDIFEEIKRICSFQYALCIIDKTLGELENIKLKGKTKDILAANVALNLIRLKNIDIINTGSGKDVDGLILERADKGDIAATCDKMLKSELKKKGIDVIVLRQRKYLAMV